MSFKRKLMRKQLLKDIKTYQCPKCKHKLTYHNGTIVCRHCGKTYNKVMGDVDNG